MLEHGGRLHAAAQQYGIPLADWLDLSTGLAPWPFKLPEIPPAVWQRLPDSGDGLAEQAARHYAAIQALPVAGSQAAIQSLPLLRPFSRVGVLSPCYAEHAYHWQRAGHAVQWLDESALEQALPALDVLVVVNPNNPTARLLPAERLRQWHQQLAERQGWLLVDEAFMDAQPEQSLAADSHQKGLIVLRSFGKFYGLAGIRLGFVLAEASLLSQLEEQLGPWAVSGPARWIAKHCLSDQAAHQQQREGLQQASTRLRALLNAQGWSVAGGCALFQWLTTPLAEALYQHCARQGILLRQFTEPASLRFGLPATEADWQRLSHALQCFRSPL